MVARWVGRQQGRQQHNYMLDVGHAKSRAENQNSKQPVVQQDLDTGRLRCCGPQDIMNMLVIVQDMHPIGATLWLYNHMDSGAMIKSYLALLRRNSHR